MSLDTATFQPEFGRLCDLSARALHDGADREQVRLAFMGEGDDPGLAHIRAQRATVSRVTADLKDQTSYSGTDLARELVRLGRVSRDLAEQEWMVDLPIVNPNP